MFEFLKLKRDAKKVSSKLALTKDGYVATSPLRVVIPKRYLDVGMMTIDTSVKTLGVFIIVDDSYNYSLTSIPLTIELTPYKIDTIDITGKDHMVLYFNKDDIVIPEPNLISTSDHVFPMLDDFLVKGNRPFFLNYEDLPNIFSLVRKYTGSDMADDITSITVLNSITARHADNTYYRVDPSKPIKYIGLNDPINRYNDTFSKLTSNYLKKGVIAAINRPEQSGTIHSEVFTH